MGNVLGHQTNRTQPPAQQLTQQQFQAHNQTAVVQIPYGAYMDFLCDLEDAQTQDAQAPQAPPSSPRRALRKVGAALKIWKADLEKDESRKESRKAEIRETKTEIYQLVGFYTLVQGVLFQGVSSMNVERIGSCSAVFMYATILSVLTSVATIGGLYLKLQDLNCSNDYLSRAQHYVLASDTKINRVICEQARFDWKNLGDIHAADGEILRLQRRKAKYLRLFAIFLILFLLGFAVIIPIAFKTILCSAAPAPKIAPTPS